MANISCGDDFNSGGEKSLFSRENSLFGQNNSLLAGNLAVETGSNVTASATVPALNFHANLAELSNRTAMSAFGGKADMG